ncbi:hypothetical protein ACSS6W_003216 [Trichoderma asperelloides]
MAIQLPAIFLRLCLQRPLFGVTAPEFYAAVVLSMSGKLCSYTFQNELIMNFFFTFTSHA